MAPIIQHLVAKSHDPGAYAPKTTIRLIPVSSSSSGSSSSSSSSSGSSSGGSRRRSSSNSSGHYFKSVRQLKEGFDLCWPLGFNRLIPTYITTW